MKISPIWAPFPPHVPRLVPENLVKPPFSLPVEHRFRALLTKKLLVDHRQHHLEPLHGFQCVGFVCGHNDHLAFSEMEAGSADRDLRFAVDDSRNRIEGGGVLRQALAGIEREERDGPGLFVHDHSADDGPVLVRNQVLRIDDLLSKIFRLLVGHARVPESEERRPAR